MKKLLTVLMFVCFTAANAQAPYVPAVLVSWQPVTTLDDATPLPAATVVSYDVYGGHTDAGPWDLAVENIEGTFAVRSGVQVGPDCYYVIAKVNGIESIPSDVVCLNVTATPPTSVTPARPGMVTVIQTQ